jgi:hypothetical protein
VSDVVNPQLRELEWRVLRHLAAGEDPFTGCSACGDYGPRMLALAGLRRACLIDPLSRLTEAGRLLLLDAGPA